MVALSVCASLASATARKETRIAQKTATRIPATSPPDTVHRSLRHRPGLPMGSKVAERRKVVLRPYRAGAPAPYRITARGTWSGGLSQNPRGLIVRTAYA
ncbi:hypothetical protein GCM10010245_40200 [Streptomyces spectabilis]|nr:hypothetical protein GCM10010245_40200 [Streptomyces spectabilis]